MSHDIHEGTYNYKYVTILEMPKICRDDLIILPAALAKELGGVNALGICYKITTVVHCYDPVTLRCYELKGKQYFTYEDDLMVIPFRGQETKFMIQDIQEDHAKASMINTTFANIRDKFAYCEVLRESDGQVFCSTTHLGNILKHGDSVLGFDINTINAHEDLKMIKHQKSLPDVILIRKHYPERKNKIWKLKRLQIDEGDGMAIKKKQEKRRVMDLEEFQEEIEQHKDMRKNINLYRNEEVIKAKLTKQQRKEERMSKLTAVKKLEEKKEEEVVAEEEWVTDSEEGWEDNKEMVRLEELMADMKLNEDENGNEKAIDDLLRDMENVKVKD